MRFKDDSNEDTRSSMLYIHWKNLKVRLSRSAYKDVFISRDWLTFSKFYFDLYDVFGSEISGYVLDKDLLSSSRAYTKDTVVFIPKELNSSLPKVQYRNSTSLPYCVKKEGGKYRASVSVYGKRMDWYGFSTPELAFEKVKSVKVSYYRSLASLYRGRISDKAYNTLRSYDVNEKGIVKPYIYLNYDNCV